MAGLIASKRFSFLTFLVFGLLFIFSSCANKQYQLLFAQKKNVPDSVLQKNSANIRNYRIKSQDMLQIRNLQNLKNIVDLNPPIGDIKPLIVTTAELQVFQVDDDGTVALTGLGHVPVAGLTRQEATKKIEELYDEKWTKDILLEMKIINLNVTMLGEVKGQGNISLTKDKTTLVELIGQVGGLTDRADEKDIKIIRNGADSVIVMHVDLSDMKSIANPLIMQSGDVVYVTENNRAIRNDKTQNLTSLVQPGLLALSAILLIFSLVRR